MLNYYELNINRAAQGFIDQPSIIGWFKLLPMNSKTEALRVLSHCAKEAHPTKEEAETAIVLSKLKPSFTPCVLLRNEPFPENCFDRIVSLPDNEQEKSFLLLFSLFGIADKRRRETHCKGGCTHEWHNIAT